MDDITPQPNIDTEKAKKLKIIRYVLIAVLALLLIVGGIVVYLRFKKQPSEQTSGAFPVSGESGVSPTTGGEEGEGEITGEQPITLEDNYNELYTGAIAGYTVLDDGITIQAFDREKGLIVQINSMTGTSKTISNTPILFVHDALFVKDKYLITRSLDNNNVIKTRMYELTGNADSGITLEKPKSLADNVKELAQSPDGNRIVLVIQEENNAHVDVLESDSKKIKSIIQLPISEWIPFVTNDEKVFLIAKASATAKSGAYYVNNGKLQIVVPAQQNQTVLPSPDGKKLFKTNISSTYGSQVLKSFMDNAGDEEEGSVSFATIADKCAWDNNSQFVYCGVNRGGTYITLDDWYLGKVSSSDEISGYDTQTTEETNITLKSVNNPKIDTVLLNIQKDAVFFVNKTDEHLWKARRSKITPPTTQHMNENE